MMLGIESDQLITAESICGFRRLYPGIYYIRSVQYSRGNIRGRMWQLELFGEALLLDEVAPGRPWVDFRGGDIRVNNHPGDWTIPIDRNLKTISTEYDFRLTRFDLRNHNGLRRD